MAGRRRRLAARRKALGYSQDDLAELLGVATSTVARWEAGADPRGWVLPKLVLALKLTPEALADLLAPEAVPQVLPAAPAAGLPPGDTDEMKRRDVLSLLAVTGALISLPEIGNPAPGDGTAASLAETGSELNASLWRVFSLSDSKQAVYPVVRHQLGLFARALQESQSSASRRRLCLLVGDLYQLAGEIFFDANRYADAAHCYTLAVSACREAGEFDMWACALTRHAFVELYESRFSAAAPMLSAAAQVAERGDSQLSTRYWVAAVQAEAYAGLGDFEATNRALDTAEQVHGLSGKLHNGGWLRFDGSRLAEERGTCYLALGRPDLAELALTAALTQPLSLRRRGAVLAELAALGAERRDLDKAGHYVRAALDLAGQTGSGYVGRKLEGVKTRLVPLMSDSRALALHQHISALDSVA
ncbi:helix-turn-helix transcriptional regulator [Kitasatospora sp. NRRL B-11411]|uniref:helix-turn-helix transcriptional regulator n=1 Tax=Kitasatospora sp. NRRL B-11411 TaxID=1463822 RepID=UPI0004C31DD6|nr:helix-turn-helix transcriptional regulator [Kitasatospora sp. NRRL B-11411]